MAFPLGVKKAPKGALRTIKNRPFKRSALWFDDHVYYHQRMAAITAAIPNNTDAIIAAVANLLLALSAPNSLIFPSTFNWFLGV
ncbi:hypothetical protein [Acinetobacter sp. NyZ410]|uniref:hypothetical protein n=1 Tax=Acinetobacter sp. NyZ410 TaxID=2929509 RepID=UPI001FBA4E2F|nr:hypothetical protein [Acinetobacter sp. NyZ410]UOH17171.1 hypothetical protein MTO68_15245 [Acinetobacter sp. NyZ410]